jgi:hypothetical protein
VDRIPNDSRALIRVAAAGVALSVLAAAFTFTGFAHELMFLRYPLLGGALAAVILAGWGSGRLPTFNRTLWAHAPWWARLSWLAIIAFMMAMFATMSLADKMPTISAPRKALETRGIGAVAAYFFLIAGLRRNVDVSLARGGPRDADAIHTYDWTDYHRATDRQTTARQTGYHRATDRQTTDRQTGYHRATDRQTTDRQAGYHRAADRQATDRQTAATQTTKTGSNPKTGSHRKAVG